MRDLSTSPDQPESSDLDEAPAGTQPIASLDERRQASDLRARRDQLEQARLLRELDDSYTAPARPIGPAGITRHRATA